ncbi:hypothetical protein SAMN04487767_103417 [Bacillus wiedmannii]|uniref:Uncharacterized protein n=1 Tax=Bacillus wiedmannii TaxID=1890302 RepID=A0A1G6QA35_9BACI|nr:hypothetical protein IEI_02789 [Bacillus wiedmannii]SDC88546.1 hypothetical protein SAMN04487767_103417 [Bacillus wiedmannii]
MKISIELNDLQWLKDNIIIVQFSRTISLGIVSEKSDGEIVSVEKKVILFWEMFIIFGTLKTII